MAAQLTAGLTPVPVTAGESGARVVRLDGADGRAVAYLKSGRGALADAVADEVVRLWWLRSRLPVPTVLRGVATADACWLLTEALAGARARQVLDERPADRPAVVDALAAFLRRVHALPVDACPFDAGLPRRLAEARARVDAGVVSAADFAGECAGRSAADVWDAVQALLPLDPDPVVVHGDFSLDNVLCDPSAGARVVGCVDVGGAGVADRYHDLAVCWGDLAAYGADLQRRFLTRYGVGLGDPHKLRAYYLLNELC